MKTMAMTAGSFVLLEAVRYGYILAVTTPENVSRVDDEGAVQTAVRATRNSDENRHPTRPWTGRDGLLLKAAGLVKSKGKHLVPTDAAYDDIMPNIVPEDEVMPLLIRSETERVSLMGGEHPCLYFHWTARDGERMAGFEVSTGEMTTIRRVLDGGPIDHVEVNGGSFTRQANGLVRIIKPGRREGIDILVGGVMLERLKLMLADMGDGPYDAGVGFQVHGTQHID